jgi:hypothetical protein
MIGLLPMAVLPDDQIRRLHAAILAAHLADNRKALLGGLDAAFVASLQTAPDPSSQIFRDLCTLNAIERLADGTVPLKTWLENAVALAGPREETTVLIEALQLLHDCSAASQTRLGHGCASAASRGEQQSSGRAWIRNALVGLAVACLIAGIMIIKIWNELMDKKSASPDTLPRPLFQLSLPPLRDMVACGDIRFEGIAVRRLSDRVELDFQIENTRHEAINITRMNVSFAESFTVLEGFEVPLGSISRYLPNTDTSGVDGFVVSVRGVPAGVMRERGNMDVEINDGCARAKAGFLIKREDCVDLRIDDVLVSRFSDHVELDVRVRNPDRKIANITRARFATACVVRASPPVSAKYDVQLREPNCARWDIPVAHMVKGDDVDRFIVNIRGVPEKKVLDSGSLTLMFNGDCETEKPFSFGRSSGP